MSDEEIISCQRCGCTDAAPCETEEGPCTWVLPGICSNCATERELDAWEQGIEVTVEEDDRPWNKPTPKFRKVYR